MLYRTTIASLVTMIGLHGCGMSEQEPPSQAKAEAPEAADTIYFNGTIITVDDDTHLQVLFVETAWARLAAYEAHCLQLRGVGVLPYGSCVPGTIYTTK